MDIKACGAYKLPLFFEDIIYLTSLGNKNIIFQYSTRFVPAVSKDPYQ
jgi:hypothetical protein